MDNPEEYIPLQNAKNIIINALDQFDPELASRATDVLFNKERLNIAEVPEAKTNMMMCRPAGITMKDVKAADLYIPDFAEKFGPHFTRQDNPTDHAIIDFEYDGSPHAIVYLSHELGHAIADDIQRENGRSFKDFSMDEMEEQAYFVQHIVSRYIKDNINTPAIRNDDLGDDTLKMSWERAAQYTNAGKTYETALEKAPDERQQVTIKALDQRHM